MSADREDIERDREIAKAAFEQGYVAGRSLRTSAEASKDYLDREHPLPGPRPYEGLAEAYADALHVQAGDYVAWQDYTDEARANVRAALQAAMEQVVPEGAAMLDGLSPPSLYGSLRRYLATWQPPAGDARD